MRLRSIIAGVMILVVLQGCGKAPYQPQDGDIIFQTSVSSQSRAIQLATQSRYSHMGIVFNRDGEPYVFEASATVRLTPLQEWISHGEHGHYVVKRLENAPDVLTEDAVARMVDIGREFRGRQYDQHFEWTDDRMYCSELVWKIYQRALNIEVGDLATLGDFDLTSSVVETIMRARWGDSIPLDQTVISPSVMFDSDLLMEVYRN